MSSSATRPLRELIVRNIPELERAAARAASELARQLNDYNRHYVFACCAQAEILRQLLEVADAAPPKPASTVVCGAG